MGDHALERLHPAAPRSHRIANFADWRAACQWVADSGKIPPEPASSCRGYAQTFKWYTGHSDVVKWKDVPQDAKTLVEWWRPHPGHLRHGLAGRPALVRAAWPTVGDEAAARTWARSTTPTTSSPNGPTRC